MNVDPEAILTGSRGSYWWLTSSEAYMGTLVQLCPEVILGRYLAVTSIDSVNREAGKSRMGNPCRCRV